MPGRCDPATGLIIPEAPSTLVLSNPTPRTDYSSKYVVGDSVRNDQGVMYGSIVDPINMDSTGKVVSVNMRTATGEVRVVPVESITVGGPWVVTKLTVAEINALPLAAPKPAATAAAAPPAAAGAAGVQGGLTMTTPEASAACKAAYEQSLATAAAGGGAAATGPAGAGRGAPAGVPAGAGAAAGAGRGAAGGAAAGAAAGAGRGAAGGAAAGAAAAAGRGGGN